MKKAFVMLMLGVTLCGCSRRDMSGLEGTYILDFSGGSDPEEAAVAVMSGEGAYHTIYEDGNWSYSGDTLRIRMPGEMPAVGRVVQTTGGFKFEGMSGSEKLSHVYTRVFPVTNRAVQMDGKWLALDICRRTKAGELPGIVTLDANVEIVTNTFSSEQTGKSFPYELQYVDGRSLYKVIVPGTRTEQAEILSGGNYLCFIATDAHGALLSETVYLRREGREIANGEQ